MIFNLPTWLTLFRLVLIPVVVVMLCIDFPMRDHIVTVGFAIAVVTDWFDGWLARRWQQESAFGAFLDPVADKLIVCTVLVFLLYHDPRLLMALPVVVIIGRELTVSALREWMAEQGERNIVAVGSIGKYKTAFQMIAIVLLLWDMTRPSGFIYGVGLALLWVSAILTLWSMFQYMRSALPRMLKSSGQSY